MTALILLALLSPPNCPQAADRMTVTLMQAENLALAHSDALRIQNLRIQSSARRFVLGLRDYLPRLEVELTTDDIVNTAAQDSLSDELSITLSQPVFNGGRTVAQRSLARLELALARHSLAIAREDALNDVWDKFHQVLVLQAQQVVKRDALEQSDRQLEIARAERGMGMIREIDLLDVELSVQNQEIDLQSTENDLEAALYALKKSLGFSPDQELSLEGSIDSTYGGIAMERSASSLYAIAEHKNLDMQTARYKITQLETQLSMTRSQYLPQIKATFAFSVSGAGFPLQTPSLMLGLDIAFPEPMAPVETNASGGMTDPGSSELYTTTTASPLDSVTGILDEVDMRIQLQEARASLESMTRDLGFQIRQSLASYRRHVTTIGLERRALVLEQRKLQILAQQVTSGTATRVEYLKEQCLAADKEVKLLADIMSLFKEERSVERLIGVEPGDLARLAGGDNDGS